MASRLKSKYTFVRGNFLLLTLSWVLIFLTGPIPGTYASLYYKNILGANDFLLSVISFSGTIALAVVQFPGGYLADKHGRRWLVFTMTYGLAACMLFFILAPSWEWVVLGAVLQSVCLIYQPALFAIIIDSVPPENRGAGFTLQSVINSLVSLPAPIIAGLLFVAFGLNLGTRIAFLIAMVAYLAAATLRIRLKETLPSSNGGTRWKLFEAFKEYPKSVREGLNVWSKVPRSVLNIFAVTTAISSLVIGCQTYFLIYSVEVLGIAEVQWAVVMAFMSLSVAVPGILAGFRMDVVGRKHFYVLSFLLYAPAMLLFLNASFYTMLLAFFFFGLAQVLQGTSYNSLLGDLTPRELRGKVIGCGQFFMYLSQAFATIIAGALYSYVSPQLPFILLGLGAVPLAVVAFLKVSEPQVKQL